MKYYAIYDEGTNELTRSNCIINNMICVEVTEEVYNELEKYIYDNGSIVLNPNYDKEQEEKEKDRINNLTMTPLDFIKVLEQLGLTLSEINNFLDSHLEIKTQLTYCNLVYCGVAKSFLPQTIGNVTITPEIAEQAFKIKNGEL